MLVYGLTGGIASGKSSVTKHLIELGADVVDADKIAREVVVPGSPALVDIAQTFGVQFIRSDGKLDRSALGELIFGDSDARQTLNRIIHPRIAAASQAALQTLRSQGNAIAFYEAPLLVENGLHNSMDGLIVVSLPEELQLARLQSRDGIDKSAARQRIQSQLPLSEKLALADYVIDNSQSLVETQKQVDQLWNLLNKNIAADK